MIASRLMPRSPVWLRKIPSTVSGSQGSRRGLRPAVRFAFPLGANLTLSSFAKAGIPGIMLGVCGTLITGMSGFLVYKLLKMKVPALGAAVSSTAGNAAATPAALAAAGVISTQVSDAATAQISAAIIVTAILCPMMVTFLYGLTTKKENAAA